MIISREKLTEEDILNEFDDVVESYNGIPRTIWEDSSPLKEEIKNLPKSVEFEVLDGGKVKLANGDEIEDLRGLDFITVDPENCKDMDDAVCCEVDKNGDYILYTAVADVPRYFDLPEDLEDIDSRDSIGKVYLSGGYTMYSPFKAYSILPKELSDNLCSLSEGENRLAFVTKIIIDKNTGEQKGEPEIMEGVIKSRAKLSYNTAQNIIDEKMSGIKLPNNVLQQVILGKIVADKIKVAFSNRDMVRFPDDDNRRISLVDGKIKVERGERLDYQDVIEAFMIMTNEANAKFAHEHELDVIYRVHSAPSENLGSELLDLLNYRPLYGFENEIEEASQITPGDFNRIFDAISKGNKNEVYERFLARIQTRAESSLTPIMSEYLDFISGRDYSFSHFGLQSEYYMHITSPIRRITDYVNMKNILAFVNNKKPISRDIVYKIAVQADERRAKVDEASIKFDEVVSAHYFEQNREKVSAKICDFDYSKGNVLFEDEKTGFKIYMPMESFYSPRNKVTREKWGIIRDDKIIAQLGQREDVRPIVNKDLSVSGERTNKENAYDFINRDDDRERY